MLDVIQPLPEQRSDVIVIEAIKDLPPLFARPDETHLSQSAHVVRNRRLADADGFGQCAHVPLAIRQRLNDTHAAGVAEGPDQFSHLRGGAFVEGGWIGRVRASGHG